jgi:hypothetical protein
MNQTPGSFRINFGYYLSGFIYLLQGSRLKSSKELMFYVVFVYICFRLLLTYLLTYLLTCRLTD